MLSDEVKQRIRGLAGHHPVASAAVADALCLVRERYGWVSDEHLGNVAELLGMSVAEAESIATCYTQIFRRPVGRHVILICDSVSCWIMGYNPLRDHLTARLGISLGETTADGRFTLLPTACLGYCDHAPAMMVGDDIYGDLTEENVDEILEKYR